MAMEAKSKESACVTDHSYLTSKGILKHYPSERRLSPQQENDVCDVYWLCM